MKTIVQQYQLIKEVKVEHEQLLSQSFINHSIYLKCTEKNYNKNELYWDYLNYSV